MSTFFTEIKNLSEIPKLHFRYAEMLLDLIVKSLFQMEEIDVGVFGNEFDGGSLITFTDSEFEHVIVSIKYLNESGEYILEINDQSEDFETSIFNYCLTDSLLQIIPEGVRSFMKETAENNEPALLIPGALK